MARSRRVESLRSTHKLRAWRTARGLTLEHVAAEIGMTPQNLGKIERSEVPLGEDHHEELARVLGISVPDLFRDPGEAVAGEALVPIIGQVGADTEGAIIQSDGQAGYDMAPIPPGGTPKARALEVVGHSMRAIADDGALIFFEDQRTPPTEDMIHYYAILELEDGRVLFKRLLRGSQPGLYTLESQLGPDIEDVRVVWAAEPIAIIPPKQAKRIIRRAGENQLMA